jgi:hypothetical protein
MPELAGKRDPEPEELSDECLKMVTGGADDDVMPPLKDP